MHNQRARTVGVTDLHLDGTAGLLRPLGHHEFCGGTPGVLKRRLCNRKEGVIDRHLPSSVHPNGHVNLGGGGFVVGVEAHWHCPKI